MSEGPAPGPMLAGPGPSDTFVFYVAPNNALGRVSGHFRIRPHNAASTHQQSSIVSSTFRQLNGDCPEPVQAGQGHCLRHGR